MTIIIVKTCYFRLYLEIGWTDLKPD